ncbi:MULTISPECIES: hypothetical protein [Marinobacter]|uniref:Uncharacterized protein n=1 Tax=Marinobacter suaedae TaxID=3057675 RepID=A0ABT8W4B4_9GAMM|nr:MULTISPECIES: hypothetical protein [unclassified Marinobacter]MBZ2167188.1 hypothetical protein [Marinobacter sp. F4216]MDO3723072.1 hypothetical protein [Marinobacter sp. chi1]
MNEQQIFTAVAAENSAVPTLLCGHCHSTLSRAKIFRTERDTAAPGIDCQTIGYCSADDCGAVNCCDEAMSAFENCDQLLGLAS